MLVNRVNDGWQRAGGDRGELSRGDATRIPSMDDQMGGKIGGRRKRRN